VLREVTAAHGMAMMLEAVLRQRFCECIRNLIAGVNGKDLDEALSDVLVKMMVAHINVLGTGLVRVHPNIFKNLEIHIGFGTEDLEMSLPHILD
jgi:hypothetical protein